MCLKIKYNKINTIVLVIKKRVYIYFFTSFNNIKRIYLYTST